MLTDQQIKEAIITIVQKFCPLATLILFGSRAKKTNQPNSDFDLVIKENKKIARPLYFKLKDQIEALATLKTIELLDYYDLNENFRRIITKEGIIWYGKSINAAN